MSKVDANLMDFEELARNYTCMTSWLKKLYVFDSYINGVFKLQEKEDYLLLDCVDNPYPNSKISLSVIVPPELSEKYPKLNVRLEKEKKYTFYVEIVEICRSPKAMSPQFITCV